jgi:hypothetical protein
MVLSMRWRGFWMVLSKDGEALDGALEGMERLKWFA